MISNREYFRNINQSIHPLAEEVTICRGGVEENLFDARTAPTELLARFTEELGLNFGIGVDISRLQQFSFQAADGISYFEDKLMAVYSGGTSEYLNYSFNIKQPHDDYCVNFYLDSRKSAAKFYDLDIDSYAKPTLPEGSTFASPFGHGIAPDSNRQDVYFCHPDLHYVARFFSLPAPTVPELATIDQNLSVIKVFGLSYDANSLKPLKLKRYFYPQDPNMTYILFDEVQ
ncbi:MAG: hypothetical protein JNM24_15440 [Bdellovibrionaceae bacterium]|jgi:hypothetical protein|nr:hypothetical protein [Pseudobdellovibrionaceae bacterium]